MKVDSDFGSESATLLRARTENGKCSAGGKDTWMCHGSPEATHYHPHRIQVRQGFDSCSSRSDSFKFLMISLYIDLASNGGTALPIWRLALVFESNVKVCDKGNVWRQAPSLIV